MGRGAGSIAKLARHPDTCDQTNIARIRTRPTHNNGLPVPSGNRPTKKSLATFARPVLRNSGTAAPNFFKQKQHT